MDGLMLDTEALYKRATQQAGAELGFPLSEEFYVSLIGLPNDVTESTVHGHFGSSFPVDAFRKRWRTLWMTEIETTGVALKPGLLELLTYLEERRIPKAVATSSERAYTEPSLRAAKLYNRFDHVVTVDQVGRGKPAPDLYLEAVRRLGVAPHEAVAIEDSEVGVISATTAGLRTIMVPDLSHPTDAARRAAHCVVASLHEARTHLVSLLG